MRGTAKGNDYCVFFPSQTLLCVRNTEYSRQPISSLCDTKLFVLRGV